MWFSSHVGLKGVVKDHLLSAFIDMVVGEMGVLSFEMQDLDVQEMEKRRCIEKTRKPIAST